MNTTKHQSAGAGPATVLKPLVLDTRPLFAAKNAPCEAIDKAVASLLPGQTLTLIIPFEPIPLYTKLGKMGFCHHTEQRMDGTWQVEFHRVRDGEDPVGALKSTYGKCECGG